MRMTSWLIVPVLGLWLTAPAAADANADPKLWVEPRTGMPFVWVPKGCGLIGTAERFLADDNDTWRDVLPSRDYDKAADEKPRHEVCTGGFWMGRYEVRRSEWHAVMGGEAQAMPELPVSGMAWTDARKFAEMLSAGSGYQFRLPTEAEWEYACRAGQGDAPFPTFDSLVGQAWYTSNEGRLDSPRQGGLFPANAFGLYDMLGNVWEWVEDDYVADGYKRHALYDPLVRDAQAAGKVIRGGSHRSMHDAVRCSKRSSYAPDASMPTIGFRLVRSK